MLPKFCVARQILSLKNIQSPCRALETIFLTKQIPGKQTRHHVARNSKNTFPMDKVYFRNEENSEELSISFRYVNEELRIDRTFNLARKLNEDVDLSLMRIRGNIQKELSKGVKKVTKKKKQGGEANAAGSNELKLKSIPVELWREQKVLTGMTLREIISDPCHLKLRICDSIYGVLVNHPWVVNVSLPTVFIAGVMLYPHKCDLQFGDKNHSRCAWYRTNKINPGLRSTTDERIWEHCGNNLIYNTTSKDVGYTMKLVITPGNNEGVYGLPVEVIGGQPVQQVEEQFPFEQRHKLTKEHLDGDEFRVVSYNLLANYYVDSDFSRDVLFPYCKPEFLHIDYRKQIFVKEIIGYHADIICLQEVDKKVYYNDFKFLLQSSKYDYHGMLAKKGAAAEGVAIFYRTKRFELLENHTVPINKTLPMLPAAAQLWETVSENKPLLDRITDLNTTVQIAVLRSKDTGRVLIVANTHLYFHPDADHIRLLQFGFAMLYIENLYKQLLKRLQLNEEQAGIIFCGDFNSVPSCGIYKLATENFVGADYIDFKSNESEAVGNISLRQSFQLKSAYGTPPFTNYTPAFKDCLDYIFFQADKIRLLQTVPLPSEELLSKHSGIPSVVFPSDHVALVADFKF